MKYLYTVRVAILGVGITHSEKFGNAAAATSAARLAFSAIGGNADTSQLQLIRMINVNRVEAANPANTACVVIVKEPR